MTPSLQLTYPGVLLAVLGEQLCLPIPSVVFLMAAGALSARGEMRTSIIVAMGVSGCLAADALWFWFGRRWGSQALRLLCRFTADPRASSLNAQEKFRRYGLGVLCVAKFFPGLNLIMPPLVAAEGAPLGAFLPFDMLGGLLWSGFYVALGYLFYRQVDVAIDFVEHFGRALVIAIGVPLCLYVGCRGLTLVRVIRRLRLRRISPPAVACPQTEVQQQGRSARPVGLRSRNRQSNLGSYSGRAQSGSGSLAEVSAYNGSGWRQHRTLFFFGR